jgi:D-alanine-D-alanine ligase
VRIGIAFDLKSDFASAGDAQHGGSDGGPDDRLEEYDSVETVDAIAGVLRDAGHDVEKLGGGRKFLAAMLASPPDLVFNIAEGHGTRSREAHVPSVCEMLDVSFTHSDPLTLAVSLDKAMTKHVVEAQGVATPPSLVARRELDVERCGLRFPVIAKPAAEGSSIGIRKHSRVADPATLRNVVRQLLADYRQPVLVEEFCEGPEFTVGILGNGADARVIAVMEIAPKLVPIDQFVYSVESKRNYRAEVEYHVPPRQPASLVADVGRVALAAYRALGCRDVARVDLRVDRDGAPRFLEVNPLPGLNPVTGDIVILSTRSGLPFDALIREIVDHAIARRGL